MRSGWPSVVAALTDPRHEPEAPPNGSVWGSAREREEVSVTTGFPKTPRSRQRIRMSLSIPL
jgi:hypothetical protein